MAERPPKKPATGRGLLRLVCYVHPDEHAALEEYARRKHVSGAEVVRRALRSFLKVED
jgi:hypothetical protein